MRSRMVWGMRLHGPLLTAALLAGAFLTCGCPAPGPTVVISTHEGPVRVTVEVADDDAERTQGLMYRTALADGRGMLFVFPTTAVHDFWMKNTLIPLDMIWIGPDGRVLGIRADTTPLSTVPVGVGVPSRYVLEVPGGFAARRGIAAGDPVDLRGIPPG